jgi:hypothetical protein
MSVIDASIQLGHITTADFTANPTHVLLDGQVVYCSDGANQGKYCIGDGVTALSALTFYGGISSSGITTGTTTITSGANTRVLYNNNGVVGEYAVTGTGTTAVLSTSPTFTTNITSPIIYGSSTSGGTITIDSTTNATKGNIIFGSAGNSNIHQFNFGTGTSKFFVQGKVGSLTEVAFYSNVTPSASNFFLSCTSNSGSTILQGITEVVLAQNTSQFLKVNASGILFQGNVTQNNGVNYIFDLTNSSPQYIGPFSSTSNYTLLNLSGIS